MLTNSTSQVRRNRDEFWSDTDEVPDVLSIVPKKKPLLEPLCKYEDFFDQRFELGTLNKESEFSFQD